MKKKWFIGTALTIGLLSLIFIFTHQPGQQKKSIKLSVQKNFKLSDKSLKKDSLANKTGLSHEQRRDDLLASLDAKVTASRDRDDKKNSRCLNALKILSDQLDELDDLEDSSFFSRIKESCFYSLESRDLILKLAQDGRPIRMSYVEGRAYFEPRSEIGDIIEKFFDLGLSKSQARDFYKFLEDFLQESPTYSPEGLYFKGRLIRTLMSYCRIKTLGEIAEIDRDLQTDDRDYYASFEMLGVRGDQEMIRKYVMNEWGMVQGHVKRLKTLLNRYDVELRRCLE